MNLIDEFSPVRIPYQMKDGDLIASLCALSKARAGQAQWIVQSCRSPIITSSIIQLDVGIVDEVFRTYDFSEGGVKASLTLFDVMCVDTVWLDCVLCLQ